MSSEQKKFEKFQIFSNFFYPVWKFVKFEAAYTWGLTFFLNPDLKNLLSVFISEFGNKKPVIIFISEFGYKNTK